MGGIILDPPSDNWVRTLYTNTKRIESTGAEWAEVANEEVIGTINESPLESTNGTLFVKDIQDPDYNHYRRRIRIVKKLTAQTQEIRRTFQNVLQGPSHEFDYVESIKLTSEADPYMRSRNVFFNANGLKPNTKHHH